MALSARFAFYDLFSTFLRYDDEGYLLMAVKLLLDGNILYDQIATPYGPFYFLFKWFVHAGLSVPLTHDAIRFVTLVHWLLLAATCGLVVRRVTGSWGWRCCGYVAVFVSMRAFRNEPGHAQEVAALLAASIPLIARRSGLPRGARGWFVGGVLVGCVLLSKVNAGVFCLAAAVTVLVSETRPSMWATALRDVLILGSAATPLLLTRPHWSEPGCIPFAMLGAGATGGAAIAVLSARGQRSLGRVNLSAFLVGIAAAFALGAAFLLAHGSTGEGLVRSLIEPAIFLSVHSLLESPAAARARLTTSRRVGDAAGSVSHEVAHPGVREGAVCGHRSHLDRRG